MFQFAGFPRCGYGFTTPSLESVQRGCPIQKSAGQWTFAPLRGLSQLVTSFFGSQCQGIRLVPFFAWPLFMLFKHACMDGTSVSLHAPQFFSESTLPTHLSLNENWRMKLNFESNIIGHLMMSFYFRYEVFKVRLKAVLPAISFREPKLVGTHHR